MGKKTNVYRRLQLATEGHDQALCCQRRHDAISSNLVPHYAHQLQPGIKLHFKRRGIARIELEQPVSRPVDISSGSLERPSQVDVSRARDPEIGSGRGL